MAVGKTYAEKFTCEWDKCRFVILARIEKERAAREKREALRMAKGGRKRDGQE